MPEHFDALARLGPTIHHRRSFAPVAAAYGDLVTADMATGTIDAGRVASLAPGPYLCRSRPEPERSGPMLYVSIFVELLRSRPALAVWLAALVQALLWTLVPALFYAAPPGDVPNVLAVGHEFQLGTYLGPPLAFWLAEVAFDLAGGGMFGVYLLSQVCVVVTYWAVFTLGRAIVGAQHAALAVLLMVGVAAFTVPTPDFGPVILTMPLWAIILLHYWRAVGEGRRGYWLLLAIEIGLLLLTTYVGLILVGLLVLFTLGNPRARARAAHDDPWIAAVVAVIVMVPASDLAGGFGERHACRCCCACARRKPSSEISWHGCGRSGLILAAHAGLIVLVALVAGWPWPRHEPAPVIVRRPVDPFARQFVYFFAIAAGFRRHARRRADRRGRDRSAASRRWSCSPGLLVVVAAGDAIQFSRQHVVIATWFGLLVIPPIMAVVALVRAALAQRRPAGDRSGRRDGAVLRGKLRAPHRCAVAVVAGDPAHRRAGRARRPEPAEPLSRAPRPSARRGSRPRRSRPRARSWSGRPPIPPARRRPRSRSAFRISCPRSRARSSARCRAGCRSCASAGR